MAKKSRKFLRFLIGEKEERREKKFRYVRLICSIDKVLDRLSQVYEEVKDSDVFKNLKIVSLNDNILDDLVKVFNKALLAGYDPYQPIDLEAAKKFPKESTFIGYLYGKPVSFITYTIEEENGETIAVIAGLGVIPEYRNRGVAKSTIIKSAEILKKKLSVSKLICEVYEKNVASYNLVKKFGFVEDGYFYL